MQCQVQLHLDDLWWRLSGYLIKEPVGWECDEDMGTHWRNEWFVKLGVMKACTVNGTHKRCLDGCETKDGFPQNIWALHQWDRSTKQDKCPKMCDELLEMRLGKEMNEGTIWAPLTKEKCRLGQSVHEIGAHACWRVDSSCESGQTTKSMHQLVK